MDHCVVMVAPQCPYETCLSLEPAHCSKLFPTLVDYVDAVDVLISRDHRRGFLIDEHVDPRLRELLPEEREDRGHEKDVAVVLKLGDEDAFDARTHRDLLTAWGFPFDQ